MRAQETVSEFIRKKRGERVFYVFGVKDIIKQYNYKCSLLTTIPKRKRILVKCKRNVYGEEFQ